MNNQLTLDKELFRWRILLMLTAASTAYFLPAASHALGFPLYLLEPMRLVIIIGFLMSDVKGAYFLAATMPLFSFIVTGHPLFPKLVIISVELVSFVFFFYYTHKRFANLFWAIITSMIVSKILYYGLKYVFILTFLLNSELVSTPLFIQLIITLGSGVIFLLPRFRDLQ